MITDYVSQVRGAVTVWWSGDPSQPCPWLMWQHHGSDMLWLPAHVLWRYRRSCWSSPIPVQKVSQKRQRHSMRLLPAASLTTMCWRVFPSLTGVSKLSLLYRQLWCWFWSGFIVETISSWDLHSSGCGSQRVWLFWWKDMNTTSCWPLLVLLQRQWLQFLESHRLCSTGRMARLDSCRSLLSSFNFWEVWPDFWRHCNWLEMIPFHWYLTQLGPFWTWWWCSRSWHTSTSWRPRNQLWSLPRWALCSLRRRYSIESLAKLLKFHLGSPGYGSK